MYGYVELYVTLAVIVESGHIPKSLFKSFQCLLDFTAAEIVQGSSIKPEHSL